MAEGNDEGDDEGEARKRKKKKEKIYFPFGPETTYSKIQPAR